MKHWSLLLVLIMVVGYASVATAVYYDFGGETVTLFNVGETRFEEGGLAEGRIEEAEELFNCRIEFVAVPWSPTPETIMTRLISGDSENDLIHLHGMQFWTLVAQGAFFPISEIVGTDYYDNLPGMSGAIARHFGYAGSTYGFGATRVSGIDGGIVVIYNKELLEAAGAQDPYELFANGEWTWDAMTEIAKLATRDTTGDGLTNQWGIGYNAPLDAVCRILGFSNNARFAVQTEDGRLVFSLDSPEAQEVFELLQYWRANGLSPTWARSAWLGDFPTGTLAMAFPILYQLPSPVALGLIDFDYGIVPLPMGPRMDKNVGALAAAHTFLLPANSRHPEGMMELQAFLFTDEDYHLSHDELIRSVARDRNSAAAIQYMHDNWNGEIESLFAAFAAELRPIAVEIVQGERTAGTALGEIRPQIQSRIDELLQQ